MPTARKLEGSFSHTAGFGSLHTPGPLLPPWGLSTLAPDENSCPLRDLTLPPTVWLSPWRMQDPAPLPPVFWPICGFPPSQGRICACVICLNYLSHTHRPIPPQTSGGAQTSGSPPPPCPGAAGRLGDQVAEGTTVRPPSRCSPRPWGAWGCSDTNPARQP